MRSIAAWEGNVRRADPDKEEAMRDGMRLFGRHARLIFEQRGHARARLAFFFAPGIFPIRGSRARMKSQARRVASSKSGASAGRICQPVTSLPSTEMERICGKSRRRLS